MNGRIYPAGAPILAPLAGHTDLPMRLSARRHGCRYAFTEMIDAGSLVFGNAKTMTLIRRDPAEDFLGVQLVGSDHDTLKKAVEILNGLDFSVLDFNLGCPAPKVAKKGEGASFALQRPDEAIRAFSILTKYAKMPVTAKIRILDENDPEKTVSFAKRLEGAGAQTITVHGRIMKMFYSGTVHHTIIRAVQENLSIPVVANGGALSSALYHTLLRESGCENGMVARGALGNPWIFREIADPEAGPPSPEELAEEMERHFFSIVDFYGEELALRISRKTLLEYLRGRGFPGELRASVSFLHSIDAFRTLMTEVRKGPSVRYWQTLAQKPTQERRLRHP